MTEEAIEKENAAITQAYKELLKVSYTTLSKEDIKLIRSAFEVALDGHKDQRRKSGEAYIFHPIAVAKIVARDIGLGATSIAAALMHDVVEDTDVTYIELAEAGMSLRVIAAVRALTKIKGQGYDEYRDAVFANRDAMIVKLADLRHNTDIRRLKGVTIKDRERMARYHEFAFDIQQRLQHG